MSTWGIELHPTEKNSDPNACSEWTLANATNRMAKSKKHNTSETTGQIVKTSNCYTPLASRVFSGTPSKQTHIHGEPQHNLHHHQGKNPTKLHVAGAIPTIINGRIPISRNNKVNTERTVKINNCSSATQHNKAHKILIIGDSHIRNRAANVKSNIKSNFKVQGVVKPGAGVEILTNSMINEIKSLSKSDVVVFCGGAKDVGRNNSSKALHQIMNFMVHCEHTNIILLTAPPRYDLMQSSCVNNEINSFNRKLKKIIKVHHHASILDIVTIRNLFTTHGLHLNGQGKEKLANQIVRRIYSILKQEKDSPLPLKWKKTIADVMKVNNEIDAETDKMNQPGNTITTSSNLDRSCSPDE